MIVSSCLIMFSYFFSEPHELLVQSDVNNKQCFDCCKNYVKNWDFPGSPLLKIPLSLQVAEDLTPGGGTQKGLPSGSVVKNPPANAGAWGDGGSIPGWRQSPGGGNGNPLQYCLENPRTEVPGGLQSMGLQSQTRFSD